MNGTAQWLEGLGLGRYAALFAQNAIDEEVLPTLTAADLVDLGIASVGHRRKLLNAIAALRAGGPAWREAERRHLSVLFVDLVGSTQLARQLDPEDMGEVIGRYQRAVAQEILRLEGHVAKFMGDGVLAYFGWPAAHENEAERAVRAGMAAIAAVARLHAPGGEALAARAGVATGMVMVGEQIGDGAAREETVVGETPSLAARLQALAPPHGLLIAQATRRQLGGAFELAPLAEVELKGFDAPVAAWRVLAEAPRSDRFAARHDGDLGPFVGRGAEIETLLALWGEAGSGRGRGLVLVGEAGIGKSRLLRQLRQAAAPGPSRTVCWQGSPFHGDSPLWPVACELQRSLDGGGPEELERLVGDAGLDPGQAVPPLAALLGLPAGSRHPPMPQSAAIRRQRLLAALIDLVRGIARQRPPLLLILEDAHWADPTTLQLVRLLLAHVEEMPVLLVVAGRPEGLPDLPERPAVRRLRLGRLDAACIGAIVDALGALPADMRHIVVDRADGVPLFAEELARAVAEREAEAPAQEVPGSLHDTLMARLDRHPGSKEIAQIAACIGRTLDHALLAAVTGLAEPELMAALDELCAAGILECSGTPPDATYSFGHALLRDAAYESLLRSRRRAVHRSVLAVLETAAGTPPEQLAHHAHGAEQWAKAMSHYGEAGGRAVERAAYAEGLSLLARALDAGTRLRGDAGSEIAVIDLKRMRARAFLATGDVHSLLVELRDAEARAARFGVPRLSCQLRTQRAHVESIFGGHSRRAVGYGREATKIAVRVGDAELASAARFVLGQAFWVAGDYAATVAELGHDLGTYRDGRHMGQTASGATLAAEGLAVFGSALGALGRYDEAREIAAEAQALAARTGHPLDLAFADWHLALTLLAQAQGEEASVLLERCLDLALRFGLPLSALASEALLGRAACLLGRAGEALERLDRVLDGCAQRRLRHLAVQALLAKVEASLVLGRPEAAGLAAEALEMARAHGYRAWEATALRLSAAAAESDPAMLAEAETIAASLKLAPELALIAAERQRASADSGKAAASNRAAGR